MFLSFNFTEENQLITPIDSNRIGTKTNFAQINDIQFPPIAPISTDLDTNIFSNSLGDMNLGDQIMPSDLGDLCTYLNGLNSNYTWSYSYGKITVTNANNFTINDTKFSKLILGCTDFTTSSNSHTFNNPSLYPFSHYIILSNELLGSREMTNNKYIFKSFVINGDEYLNGMGLRFDSSDLINQSPIKFSRDTISQGINIPFGVLLNDFTTKIIKPTKTRPFSVTIFYTNETGFEL